jgi:predicted outer membrane lipoprotein
MVDWGAGIAWFFSWILGILGVLAETFWGIINSEWSLVGIALLFVVIFIVYGIFQLGVNSSWSMMHWLMYGSILVIIAIVLWVVWTGDFGFGQMLRDWLIGLFGGG